jgi:hypothetical protein
MTTRKPATADDAHWTVLLPTGETVLWDGLTMPLKLGRNMLATTDGRLVNAEMVVALTPPRQATA